MEFLKSSFCLVIILCAFTSFAQKSDIEVVSDHRLDSLVHVQSSIDTDFVCGFRIVLTTEKTKTEIEIEKHKRKYTLIHPEVRAYIVFESPNYILKVGDFQFKEDTYLLKEQLNNYPFAFIKEKLVYTKRN